MNTVDDGDRVGREYPRAVMDNFEYAKTAAEELTRMGYAAWKKRTFRNRWEIKADCPLHVFIEVCEKYHPHLWNYVDNKLERI